MYKLLAVIAVLILIEELAEFVYKHSASYRASRSGYAHIHGEIPGGLEIVNVGSGPGLNGIGYEYCTRKGFNFSTAPQNFIYGFRLIKHFTDKISHGATVIIIICTMSFGRNNDCNSPGYSDKYYGVLPPEDIDRYSRLRVFVVAHPLMRKVSGKIRSIVSRIFTLCRNSAAKSNVPDIIRTWTSEFALENLTDPSQAEAHKDFFTQKIGILSDEIEYCKAHGWNPVFVIPPVSEKARGYISSEFVKVFVHDNMKQLTQKFPDVRVLDYYDDARFTNDMFSGDIFLNEKGREIFSRILFGDINKEGI